MTYAALMDDLSYMGTLPQGQATHITQDSRRVAAGSVFVCISGRGSNGHTYAQQALNSGAGLIITQQALGLEKEVVVEDTRLVYALLCQRFFGNPAQKLCLVAVTGTNGKTTVSSILKQVLEAAGHPCGLIGTIRSEIRGMYVPARYTTPEAWDLAALMHRMVLAGCTHLVMEASSQALDQGRLLGLPFALSIFTNLTKDHLDWHGDMEAYFKAKKSLFSQSKAMLCNLDDAYGVRLLEEEPLENKKSFSCKSDAADFVAHNIQLSASGVRFGFLAGEYLHPLAFPMPGEYSAYNALAAGGAAVMLGLPAEVVLAALETTESVPGRCEVLHQGKFTVIRDFAHTGDGLEKLLKALRPFAKNRLVVLYGCAGEREASKRAEMSEAALRHGDIIYLTSDNPRGEPEEQIFAHALPPLKQAKTPYTVVARREEAVALALGTLQEDDLLVLCGKGHEDYQVLNGYTVYLDEKLLVQEWLAAHQSHC